MINSITELTYRTITSNSPRVLGKILKTNKIFASQTKFFRAFYKGFEKMMTNMFRLSHYFKIFYSIIKFVTVYMMNNLAILKLSSKVFFHYKSMFTDWFSSINPNRFVAICYCTLTSFSTKTYKWVSVFSEPDVMEIAI